MRRALGQLWGYIAIGGGSAAKARFEATTEKPLLLCSSSQLRCVTGCKLLSSRGSCSIIEPKGGHLVIEAEYAVERIAYSPPAYAHLPVFAEDPYLPLEAQLVIDGPPKILVYGLTDRHSNVITYTMRTVLEGLQAPQLLIVSKDHDGIIGHNAIMLEQAVAMLFQYPVMGPFSEVFDKAKLCEQMLGPSFWPRCYHDALTTSRMKSVALRTIERVVADTAELEKAQALWVLSRAYASAAYMSRTPCVELARRIYESGSLLLHTSLVFERLDEQVLAVKTSVPLRLLLREPGANGTIVYDQVVQGEALFGCTCTSVAYLCETCWEPIV